jgi:putative tryptophan/tyrosine transport system substrate-binding protein
MNRRDAAAWCAALCLPNGLLAQPAPHSARVGLLVGSVPPQDGGRWPTQQALLQRLRELGWTEGSNLQVVLRYGHGTSEGMARAADELAALGPDVIVAAGTQPVRALQRATTTIPIVMAGAGDPVGSGLVASLSRPGGHTTGVSLMGQEVIPKTMSLLREAVPSARRIDLLSSAANPANPFFARIWADAVMALGIEGQIVELRGPDDIEPVIAGSRADAIVMLQDPFYGGGNLARATAAAIRRRLPLASTGGRNYAAAGCLLAYSHNELNVFRQAADYADRILRGARPGDLPIDQPARYELILNQKTARAIGVAFSRALLLRADEVIE